MVATLVWMVSLYQLKGLITLLVTNESTSWLDRVEIGRGNETDFWYIEGENDDTVWEGIVHLMVNASFVLPAQMSYSIYVLYRIDSH